MFLADNLVTVEYMVYLLYYIVIFSLFVYCLGLQTMLEALCKDISRFKSINNLKYIFISSVNKNNLRISLDSSLNTLRTLRVSKNFGIFAKNDPSIKIVCLNKHLHCPPFRISSINSRKFFLQYWVFRIYILVSLHISQC